MKFEMKELQYIENYGRGFHPSVSINKEQTIVLSWAGEGEKVENPNLYYRVYLKNPTKENWSAEGVTENYDKGNADSMAINSNNDVISIKESDEGRLFYRIGTLSSNKIDFLESEKFDGGRLPDVGALSTDEKDEFFMTAIWKSTHSDNCFYRAGIAHKNEGTISWYQQEAIKYTEQCKDYPTVALNGDRHIVLGYNRDDNNWYILGNWDSTDKKFNFSGSEHWGAEASVSCLTLADDDFIWAGYTTEQDNDGITYRAGLIVTDESDGWRISWQTLYGTTDDDIKYRSRQVRMALIQESEYQYIGVSVYERDDDLSLRIFRISRITE